MQSVRSVTLLTLAFCLAAPTAQAQQTEVSAEEATAALNRDQAEFAQNQHRQNVESQQAHDEAVQAAAAELERQQEEMARQEREYEEAMARWRADVAACEAGNISRCAPPE